MIPCVEMSTNYMVGRIVVNVAEVFAKSFDEFSFCLSYVLLSASAAGQAVYDVVRFACDIRTCVVLFASDIAGYCSCSI